ncbi:MAG: 3-hydroxyacyl-ACP dehydratase FabZ [bacterium]|uniref:3-hydroxyacyl-[acyl-carrier-protein] dehydratase FabZ n=2 Tax=Bacteria candidate phyla TaxID=1783234 RepID=A0A101I0X1_UNCT6|nr:MAG: 3-hydroxyacyl-[acyl-carrier-protein] dehydratase [candidate division TA06 bacterium 32_111]KUK86688.1 MAG: 3-hydroxyacyl-[acyl-carrier-protein] dehydratase [candidate division TA06 bacterium 34_109]MDI6700188.1 3-hydroxyacyl-ACP dehydratase FabZ [bacterium]HAF08377.1 3-hydroxyacyl-[acyl-carrier-protein] dehydratase FabZ [candidate division WOR-3 bacterium]HCP17402.1 3-hydroxyacyl-[acyl-carrier-protein] dehydratase FabZ [candidate division WOR-3 bacterium]
MEDNKKDFDIVKIMKVIPHRYPMLLVDRILEIDEKKVVGKKCVSMDEHFFQGHYPQHPVMPGVLIIESLAQTGAMLISYYIENVEEKVPYFVKIDRVKFRKPVFPGDVLINECVLKEHKGNFFVLECKSYVDEKVVCEGELTAAIVDKER